MQCHDGLVLPVRAMYDEYGLGAVTLPIMPLLCRSWLAPSRAAQFPRFLLLPTRVRSGALRVPGSINPATWPSASCLLPCALFLVPATINPSVSLAMQNVRRCGQEWAPSLGLPASHPSLPSRIPSLELPLAGDCDHGSPRARPAALPPPPPPPPHPYHHRRHSHPRPHPSRSRRSGSLDTRGRPPSLRLLVGPSGSVPPLKLNRRGP